MKIVVLGAGAWGTALAQHASAHHAVSLWARSPAQRAALRATRQNQRYLPGVELSSRLHLIDSLQALNEAPELLVVATPTQGLREALSHVVQETDWTGLGPAAPLLVLACKGFERDTALLGLDVANQVAPGLLAGVLSGPSFADEVAKGQPTAIVVASHHTAVNERVSAALHAPTFRVYTSHDPIGVEVGGAVKNVMALAAGLCDGLALQPAMGSQLPGLNARAALMTRGLAEMTRLAVALGAQPDTLMGLSGLGDLVLTCTGALSRNRQVGMALAAGRPLAEVLAQLGHVAEGVHTAPVVLQKAQALGVDMPITEAMVRVLQGQLSAVEGARLLMAREPRSETLA